MKHKGTVGRRLLWTALIGVPIAPGAKYDYVDSVRFPSSKMSYHGKELEDIQASGTHVVVLDKFSSEALAAARQSCAVQTPEVPKAAMAEPATPVKVQPSESDQHQVKGSTISEPNSDVGSAAGDQTSLGDAARQAKLKKQQQPKQ